MGKLSAVAVKAALANPGTYQDGDGLFLKVGRSGSASWLVRLQQDGKRRDIGLGSAKLLTLAEAREKAGQLRKAIKVEKRDVLAERKDEAAAKVTFRDAARQYHSENEAGWKSAVYALLLVSKVQGVGKSTLAVILRELLGPHNCSMTTAREITQSPFNSWIGGKRLVVVDEVYAGHSAELANTIKPIITGDKVPVNRKFKEPYEVSNHAHFLLMSNSRLPLFLEEEDRRWLIPEVTEAKKPDDYWSDLHRWLRNGGYGIIAHWAECFVRAKKRGAARTGSHAPGTEAKARMIEASRSGAEKQLRELSEYLIAIGSGASPQRVILPVSVLMEWFRNREHLSPSDRKISERAVLEMLSASLRICAGDQRCDLGGRKITAIINFEKRPEDKWPALVRAGCLWDMTKMREAFDVF